ncbi:MAG: hydroxyacid dehydrogenase [Candidatus Coatesbacteria bacterium]
MKPIVAIPISEGTRAQVLDPATIDSMRGWADVVLPKGPGDVKGAEAEALLAGADGVMTGWGSPALTAELLAKAPRIRILAHSAGTVKPFVSDALWARGITVTTASPVIAVAVAQFAVAMMIMGRKNVFELSPQVAAGGWWGLKGHRGPDELRGSTVGLVGAGSVGREVLKLLPVFGARVLLSDPFVDAAAAKALGAEKVELDELFSRADVVSLHAPPLPATTHIVNAARLASMRDGALLVNTARGLLIDEAALVAELKRRRIWAILDVTDPEPPQPGSILLGCPNLTLTPHIAGSVGRGRLELGATAAEELRRFFAGEPPLHPVRREDLAKMA